jgi:hypothetical protein
MSAIVDYSYYVNTYMGSEANETSFPALYAHASRIIGAMTRFQVDESNFDTFPPFVQNCYKLALCAQIDSIAINGIESISAGNNVGFSVGKVRVDSGSKSSAVGALSASVSPASVAYLEQTGLLNPAVPCWEGFPC